MTKLIYSSIAALVFTLSVTNAQTVEVFKTEVSETRSVAFSDDNKLVAYGISKKIYIIDAETKKTVRIIEGATGDVYDLAFVGNRLIATGGKYLGIWDAKTGKVITLSKRDEYTYKFSICRKTNTVFLGGMFIEAWNIKTGKSLMKTEKFQNKTESFAVSPDGKKLYVSPEWGNSILILDAKTGKQLDDLKNISRAKQMLFHPDGKSLFIWQFGKKIKQINLKGEVLLEVEPQSVWGQLFISGNGEYLLMPTWSTQREIEQVIVYDIKNKKTAKILDVSDKSIYEAKMSSDKKTIVAATKDNLLHFISFKK